MKKFLTFLLLIITSFSLIGCSKEEVINYDELTHLEYFDYLGEHNPLVTIRVKDYGVMKAELFADVAPNTVENFISYINDKAYNESSFHRIIEKFMIQGGIVETTNPPIYGEFNQNGFKNDLKHYKGVLSMARSFFPNSATSQFFIVHRTSSHLDGAYAAFGALVSGFDVLDKIATTKTNSNDAPVNKVIIESITINLRGYSS